MRVQMTALCLAKALPSEHVFQAVGCPGAALPAFARHKAFLRAVALPQDSPQPEKSSTLRERIFASGKAENVDGLTAHQGR
jgi:hypothetical protein